MPPYVRVRWPLVNDGGGLVGWAVWNDLADRVAVEGGYLPAEFHVDFPGSAGEPSAKATFVVRSDGSVGCVSVSLDAKRDGPEVKPKDLDAARLQLNDWMQLATMAALQDAEGRPVVPTHDDNTPAAAEARMAFARSYNEARRQSRRKVTPEFLADVANLYREYLDDGPWQAIQDRYGVSASTAGRYVLLARRAGLLPPTDPGKRKA